MEEGGCRVRSRGEKIIKSRAGWKKADQVKKIKIVMTVVAVALCLSVAAGAVLAWMQIKHPFDKPVMASAPVSSAAPPSSETESLPVYDDSYNLVLVNNDSQLKPDFTVSLTTFDGVQVDEKIVPALKKMMEDAKAEGCPLKLTSGYIDAEQQDKLFQAEVQNLMKNQGYSQVRAENQAQIAIGRGGYNENQTGMAVEFDAEGVPEKTDFTTTDQYKWLVKNCVSYGFILRYPENKTGSTGKAYQPHHFRYVGVDNAVKMREYSMCLEEYVSYMRKQSAG
jgi:D-alanyl-D-alanine carboxypeptidase